MSFKADRPADGPLRVCAYNYIALKRESFIAKRGIREAKGKRKGSPEKTKYRRVSMKKRRRCIEEEKRKRATRDGRDGEMEEREPTRKKLIGCVDPSPGFTRRGRDGEEEVVVVIVVRRQAISRVTVEWRRLTRALGRRLLVSSSNSSPSPPDIKTSTALRSGGGKGNHGPASPSQGSSSACGKGSSSREAVTSKKDIHLTPASTRQSGSIKGRILKPHARAGRDWLFYSPLNPEADGEYV